LARFPQIENVTPIVVVVVVVVVLDCFFIPFSRVYLLSDLTVLFTLPTQSRQVRRFRLHCTVGKLKVLGYLRLGIVLSAFLGYLAGREEGALSRKEPCAGLDWDSMSTLRYCQLCSYLTLPYKGTATSSTLGITIVTDDLFLPILQVPSLSPGSWITLAPPPFRI